MDIVTLTGLARKIRLSVWNVLTAEAFEAHTTDILRAALAVDAGSTPLALSLIAAERVRQVSVEGWTPDHDDNHGDGELAAAAASYAWPDLLTRGTDIPAAWPWADEWWKPTPDDRIREMVKAGALIVAEIERLQRLTGPRP